VRDPFHDGCRGATLPLSAAVTRPRLASVRVLIAGATGVLGSRLLPALVSAGHEVTGTSRRVDRHRDIREAGGEPVAMDALDADSVARAIAAARPDVIVHLLTDLSGRDWAGNARVRVEGTTNLVDAALDAGVDRMIAESVSWRYQPDDRPATEDEPAAVDPVTGGPVYAPVESLDRDLERMPHGTVLRYGLLYGPGTWYAPDGMLSREAGAGRVVATTDRTSWIHVDDAVAATVLALGWPAGPVNVVDDDPCLLADWGPVLAERGGYTGDALELVAGAPGRAADNGLARSLGWTPSHPTWRDGLGLG
jgi:nucleoside-diphosphate-sugar epimerase